MDKCNTKVTIDYSENIEIRRFNFCPKQSYFYIFTVIVLAFVMSAFSILQIIPYYSSPNSSGYEITASEKSLNNQSQTTTDGTGDNKIDPCNNFYKFACKDWQQKNPEPETNNLLSSNQWTVIAVQNIKINKLVIDILEEPIQDNDLEAMTQAKKFYRKCLTENKHLQSILGGDLGETGYPESNEICIVLIKKVFNTALSHKIAVLKYRDMAQLENIRTEIYQMFENIRNGFKRLDARFLSNSVDKTKLCVGIPDWIFNRTRVQAEYNELVLDTNDTYDDQLVAAYNWQRKISAESQDTECPWSDFLGPEGAYYFKPKNLIYLPLAFLELPYFSQNQSQAQKYGSLGFVIGHELAHAYFMPNPDLIENSTLNCLKNQYSSLSAQELHGQHNPRTQDRILHENVGDNFGLLVATQVYSQLSQLQSGNDAANQKMDNNKNSGHYTNEQLLFLSFAQTFCEFPSKPTWRDSHSPGISRVLGTLQNSRKFAKAWNCSIGSPMNPSSTEHKKCEFISAVN